MLGWFRAFLPKEERFFDLFARHAQTVVQGALALQDMLRGGDETPVFSSASTSSKMTPMALPARC